MVLNNHIYGCQLKDKSRKQLDRLNISLIHILNQNIRFNHRFRCYCINVPGHHERYDNMFVLSRTLNLEEVMVPPVSLYDPEAIETYQSGDFSNIKEASLTLGHKEF